MTKEKKKTIIIGISHIVAIIVVIGVSYAYWTSQASQKTINRLNTNCLEVNIEDEANNISLLKEFPITDKEAESLTPFTFKIHNTCNVDATYSVQLEVKDEANVLSDEYIALSYNGNDKELLNKYTTVAPTVKEADFTANKAYQITTGTIKANEKKDFSLKLWVDESVDINDDAMNKNFTSKVTVTSENIHYAYYKEDLLNGADPVLGENLIPVIIDNSNGNVVVKRADLEKKWYEYGKQEWANAVILTKGTPEPDVGAVIDENNIESYFVWIPRYKYKIWDEGNYSEPIEKQFEDIQNIPSKVQPIEIQFETTNDVASTGSTKESWLTHPAFTAFGVNGIWVGKFESGYKDADSTEAAQQNTNESTNLQIKPNVYSWRGIQTANAHLVSYNYQRGLDSHLMKNTEWGAVAYLTNSIYGRCKDNQCNEVRTNNTSDFKTGYAAVNSPTLLYDSSATSKSCKENANACNEFGASTESEITQPWNTDTGMLASTTGNISGIYDMSGGAHDRVMGVLADEQGNPMSGATTSANSGFSGKNYDGTITSGIDFPDKKYYDVYKLTNGYMKYKFGDATKELGPFYKINYTYNNNHNANRLVSSWYVDDAILNHNTIGNIWILRGGATTIGLSTGIFDFSDRNGDATTNDSFRVVLAP